MSHLNSDPATDRQPLLRVLSASRSFGPVPPARPWICGLLAVASVTVSGLASAVVRFEGDWPAEDETVSLSVESTPRVQVLRQVADQAGWSVLLEAADQQPVDLLVQDQPARKVLEMLLREGSWIAHREGTLVSIAPVGGDSPDSVPLPAVAPAAPAPSASPTSSSQPPSTLPKRPPDRFITGSNLTVHAGETVGDVAVLGGSAEILGTVTGDLAVFGGAATIRKGAHVAGDCAVFGGSLSVEPGGEIMGHEMAMGGEIRKGDEVVQGSEFPFAPPWSQQPPMTGKGFATSFSRGLAHTALFFLFGAGLLAVAHRRMEALQVAAATKPFRSLLEGIVAGLLLALATVLLAVTCIGIPIAAGLVILALFAAGAGVSAILTTVGTALVRHRSQNPYLHLAVGCGLFLVVSFLPFVGPLTTFLLSAAGLGVVLLTRGAGLWPRTPDPSQP